MVQKRGREFRIGQLGELTAVVLLLVGCAGQTATTVPTTAPTTASAGAAASIPADFAANLITPGEITAATTGNAPPGTMTADNGDLVGYHIDRCKAVAAHLGVPIKFVVMDFASNLTALSTGRADMTCTGMERSGERVASADFSMTCGTVYSGITFVARADDATINSLQDAKGKTFGGVQGGAETAIVQDYLRNDVKVVDYPSVAAVIQDLKNKRIDFYAGDLFEVAYQVKMDPSLKVVDKTGITPSRNAEAVAENEPGLLAAVNAVEKQMRDSGELQGIQKTWQGDTFLPPAECPNP